MTICGVSALGACSLFFGGDDSSDAVLAPKVEAQPHDAAKFLVLYGAQSYLVDVRYIDLINESVIAVREAEGETLPRETFQIPATIDLPSAEPFSSRAHRKVALAIADHIRETAKICDDGRLMALRQNLDGDTRVTYRRDRGAWVVFAACPGPVAS